MAGNREVLTKKLHKQGFYICALFAKTAWVKFSKKGFFPTTHGLVSFLCETCDKKLGKKLMCQTPEILRDGTHALSS